MQNITDKKESQHARNNDKSTKYVIEKCNPRQIID